MEKVGKILTISILALILTLSQGGLILAKEGNGDRDRVKIEIENENEEVENEAEERRLEIKGNTFEIRDTITQVGTNSITIAGRVVKIDPTLSGRFKQEGNLVVGAFARVEGVIINSELIAREIKIQRPAGSSQAASQTNVEVNSNRFEARGIVSNVATDSFTISGLTIKMDPKVTGKVDIKGNLTNGAFVKAEGVVQNGSLFAQEIRVGAGLGQEVQTPPAQANAFQRLIELLQRLLQRLQLH